MLDPAKFSPSILRYPSGKYGYVGSLPYELCEQRDGKFGFTWYPRVFETYQEAVDFAASKGFQIK